MAAATTFSPFLLPFKILILPCVQWPGQQRKVVWCCDLRWCILAVAGRESRYFFELFSGMSLKQYDLFGFTSSKEKLFIRLTAAISSI